MSDTPNTRQVHREERLRSNVIAWFTSVRSDGRPHIVPVWFLWDGDTFLIFTKPGSQKVRNLQGNPQVVLALDDTNGGSDVITVEGHSELLDTGAVDTTYPAYVEKYGEEMTDLGWTPEAMATTYGYTQAIRVTPTRRP